MEGHVLSIHRTSTALCCITATGDGFERWVYTLPDLTLRSRAVELSPTAGASVIAIAPVISAPSLFVTADETTPENHLRYGLGSGHGTNLPGELAHVPVRAPSHFATAQREPDGVTVRLHEAARMEPAGSVKLTSAVHACLRAFRQHVSIADDRGRVLVINPETGAVVRNVRPS
jgi:hypothetical protein